MAIAFVALVRENLRNIFFLNQMVAENQNLKKQSNYNTIGILDSLMTFFLNYVSFASVRTFSKISSKKSKHNCLKSLELETTSLCFGFSF